MINQKSLYKKFKDLHNQTGTFILPNAWDVNSAKIFESFGFKAIGTTSAGIAASLGYEDGEKVPFSLMIEIIKHIINSVNVPVTVDLEQGYGVNVDKVIENMKKIISIGAVGINIEDGYAEESNELLSGKFKLISIIEEMKKNSKAGDNLLFINARIDIYWLKLYREETRLSRVIERANIYLDAGADCVFVPGVDDIGIIKEIVDNVHGPVNFLLGKNTPSVDMLSKLGVARLSTGSAPFRKVSTVLKELCVELQEKNMYERLTSEIIPYAEMFSHL